jgi:GntR family transcriptional regulator
VVTASAVVMPGWPQHQQETAPNPFHDTPHGKQMIAPRGRSVAESIGSASAGAAVAMYPVYPRRNISQYDPRMSVMARYREMANRLRDRITAGEYPPGSQLPTIAELASHEHMGRNTVSAAVALLEAEGIVHASPKTGIVVMDRRPVPVALSRYAAVMQPGGDLGPWETACQRAGITGRMDLIEVETVPADEDVATALELPAAGRRIVRRSRYAVCGDPEQAAQIHTSSIPARLARGTPLASTEKLVGGIYAAMTAAGIRPATATETVGCRAATDEETAELHLRGQSVLTIERVTRDSNDRPIELLEIVANPARTTLVYDRLPL